jgi:hypothetical protein
MRSTPSRLRTTSGGESVAKLKWSFTYGIERTTRSRRMIAGRFKVHHLEIMARRVPDYHRLIGPEEIGLVLPPIGIIHTADHLADSAPQVSADKLQVRKFLDYAAYDQPSDSAPSIGRPMLEARRCSRMRSSPNPTDGGWMTIGTSSSVASWKNGMASSSSG